MDENKTKRNVGRPRVAEKMEPLRVTVAPADVADLDAYCAREGIGRSEAMRRAIRKLVGKKIGKERP